MSYMPRFIQTNDPAGLNGDQMRKIAPSIYAPAPYSRMSDQYSYMPTIDMLRKLYREGFRPMYATQGRTRVPGKKDFTKHLVRLRHRTDIERGTTVGSVFPEIVFINSHDGTSCWDIRSGMFRLVCSNGMIISTGDHAMYKVKHKGHTYDEVIDGSLKVVENVRSKLPVIRRMQDTFVDREREIEFVREAAKLRWDTNVPNFVRPLSLSAPRRIGDADNTLWNVFNRVQENLIKGGTQYINPRRDARNRYRAVMPVRSIDADVKINSELWALAERTLETL